MEESRYGGTSAGTRARQRRVRAQRRVQELSASRTAKQRRSSADAAFSAAQALEQARRRAEHAARSLEAARASAAAAHSRAAELHEEIAKRSPPAVSELHRNRAAELRAAAAAELTRTDPMTPPMRAAAAQDEAQLMRDRMLAHRAELQARRGIARS